MIPGSLNRWSLAFADLALLLTGYMALSISYQQAGQQQIDHVSENDFDDIIELSVSLLFHENEAMLTTSGRQQLAKRMVDHKAARVTVSIAIGDDSSGTARLDEWELAAARTASIGRELENLRLSRSQVELTGPVFHTVQQSKIVISVS